ncbi:MAG: efflux RND transporter periplasmic adaptor subunit [Burkholderiales bacterium]|nr:efflux RND transporter periplasmic adaptor subunit [Burkholderiales bacterium]
MGQSNARSFIVFLLIGAVLLAAAAGGVWFYDQRNQKAAAKETEAKAAATAAGPSVMVAKAQQGPDFRRVSLVGEALPLRSTTLYGKVGGYLKAIHVDVGDAVKAGQVLAEIQSPELDAQINTIATGLENKRRFAQRTRDLAKQGFFSQQALDNAENDVRVAEAQIAELRTLASYRTLRAPFAGVVAQRYVDPGALITNAAANITSAQPVMVISDPGRLKVTVYPEQADAPLIKAGLEVEVTDAAAADRKVIGKVARVSGELDSRTRTLRTEVEFDNQDGRFIPGSFVNVAVLVPTQSYIEVPAGALVMQDKKPVVASVGPDSKAHFLPITVAGTDGKVLRIASGIEEGTMVVVSPPAGLAEGAKLNPQKPPGAK